MDTLSSYLEGDHARCDALYVAAVACVAAGDWDQAARSLRRFAQAQERHIAMEEQVVFVAFEKATGSDDAPTHVLRREHRQFDTIVQRLGEAIAHRRLGDFADHADTLRIMQQQHNIKEEHMLYPMADRVLRGQRGALLAAMQAISAGADA